MGPGRKQTGQVSIATAVDDRNFWLFGCLREHCHGTKVPGSNQKVVKRVPLLLAVVRDRDLPFGTLSIFDGQWQDFDLVDTSS